VALLALAWPLVHGCTTVDGGAAEVSWDLRTAEGSVVDCDVASVATIDLYVEDSAGNRYSESFACNDERGVTGFTIAPGPTELYLAPGCAQGTPVAYRAPAPIVRTITQGEVITLETQLIEVEVGSCEPDDPCTCVPPP